MGHGNQQRCALPAMIQIAANTASAAVPTPPRMSMKSASMGTYPGRWALVGQYGCVMAAIIDHTIGVRTTARNVA